MIEAKKEGKFHIGSRGRAAGQVVTCHAKKNCTLQGDNPHFDTKEEGQEWQVEQAEKEHGGAFGNSGTAKKNKVDYSGPTRKEEEDTRRSVHEQFKKDNEDIIVNQHVYSKGFRSHITFVDGTIGQISMEQDNKPVLKLYNEDGYEVRNVEFESFDNIDEAQDMMKTVNKIVDHKRTNPEYKKIQENKKKYDVNRARAEHLYSAFEKDKEKYSIYKSYGSQNSGLTIGDTMNGHGTLKLEIDRESGEVSVALLDQYKEPFHLKKIGKVSNDKDLDNAIKQVKSKYLPQVLGDDFHSPQRTADRTYQKIEILERQEYAASQIEVLASRSKDLNDPKTIAEMRKILKDANIESVDAHDYTNSDIADIAVESGQIKTGVRSKINDEKLKYYQSALDTPIHKTGLEMDDAAEKGVRLQAAMQLINSQGFDNSSENIDRVYQSLKKNNSYSGNAPKNKLDLYLGVLGSVKTLSDGLSNKGYNPEYTSAVIEEKSSKIFDVRDM